MTPLSPCQKMFVPIRACVCVFVHTGILSEAEELVLIITKVVRLKNGNGEGNQKSVRTALTLAAHQDHIRYLPISLVFSVILSAK